MLKAVFVILFYISSFVREGPQGEVYCGVSVTKPRGPGGKRGLPLEEKGFPVHLVAKLEREKKIVNELHPGNYNTTQASHFPGKFPSHVLFWLH